MKPVDVIEGQVYPLGRDNVDTDLILPGRFLKTITRTGLAIAAFESVRAEPGNIFEDPRWKGAPTVVAGTNFGCGSSREHAVWAMMDLGIRAVIAESYSDIFAGNAFKNGLLAITLPRDQVAALLAHATAGGSIRIDLAAQTIQPGNLPPIAFEINAFRKDCLLKGLDEIALTLTFDDEITAFEARSAAAFPWIARVNALAPG